MTTRPYLTLDEAKSRLIAGGFYTAETMPPDGKLAFRLSQIESSMDKWFNFRFPETDYVELLKCTSDRLLLRQYPVISFDIIEYRVPSIAGRPVTFAPSQGLWNGNREVLVPRDGIYRVTYTAGYDDSELARLQPFLVGLLGNYDKTNGLDFLWELAGDVTSVTMPGGISQSKTYLGNKKAIANQVIDRYLGVFSKYQRILT